MDKPLTTRRILPVESSGYHGGNLITPISAGRAKKQSISDDFFCVGVRQADREGCSAELATHEQRKTHSLTSDSHWEL